MAKIIYDYILGSFRLKDETPAPPPPDGNGIYSSSGTLAGATTVSMGTNNLVFFGTGGTLRYAGDYSGSYTSRSLVDKEYVDNAVSPQNLQSVITEGGSFFGTQNFSYSGLTTSSFTVDLFTGPLSLSTGAGPGGAGLNITTGSAQLNVDSGFSESGAVTAAAGSVNVSGTGSGTTGSLFVSQNEARLRLNDGIGDQEISFTAASMLVTDQKNSKGLVYATDYSANFTARSLVDKGYVDGVNNLAGTLANGNTTSGNSIILSTSDAIQVGNVVGNTIDYSGGNIRILAGSVGGGINIQALGTGGMNLESALGLTLDASFSVNIRNNNLTISENGNVLAIEANSTMSAPRTATFQDASGTVAYTSDIPLTPSLASVLSIGSIGNNGQNITLTAGGLNVNNDGTDSGPTSTNAGISIKSATLPAQETVITTTTSRPTLIHDLLIQTSTISSFVKLQSATTGDGLFKVVGNGEALVQFNLSGTDRTIQFQDKSYTVADNLDLTNHVSDTANPHSVTKTQVGLSNVPNTDATQRSNHTGTQLASTISDFAATVRSTVLTGISFASSAVITASDSVLSALGKLQAQVTINNAKVSALKTKSGKVLNATFTGNPKTATVTFGTAFADANYSVSFVCNTINDTAYIPIVENILAGSFDINMTVNNINDLTDVRWIAVKNGEN